MVSNIAPSITEQDLRSETTKICELCNSPSFSKIQLIQSLRVAYIVFPTVDAASSVLNVCLLSLMPFSIFVARWSLKIRRYQTSSLRQTWTTISNHLQMKKLPLIIPNLKGLNTPTINIKTGFAEIVIATTLPAGPNATNAVIHDRTFQACALNYVNQNS